jgi:hypothetical protein
MREADEEHCNTDDGEEICCPICGRAWLEEMEGDYDFDSCQHLRFSLHSDCDDDFEFFGNWDIEVFLELAKKVREKDEYAEILDIILGIQHPDLDKAIVFVWQDDPLNHPWMLWGYKE